MALRLRCLQMKSSTKNDDNTTLKADVGDTAAVDGDNDMDPVKAPVKKKVKEKWVFMI